MQEDVGALQVSVENLNLVERLEPTYDLNKYFPDKILRNVLLLLLMRCNFLEQITAIRILHYNTIRILLNKENEELLTIDCSKAHQ